MIRPRPTDDEFLAQLSARLADARRSLESGAASAILSAEMRVQYERIMAAVDELERRLRELRSA